MFVILFYDVNAKRCNKMLKTCRKYLTWVQNSVLEGDISNASFEKMIFEINHIIEPAENDSVVVYKFRQMRYFKREVFGADKKGDLNFF